MDGDGIMVVERLCFQVHVVCTCVATTSHEHHVAWTRDPRYLAMTRTSSGPLSHVSFRRSLIQQCGRRCSPQVGLRRVIGGHGETK